MSKDKNLTFNDRTVNGVEGPFVRVDCDCDRYLLVREEDLTPDYRTVLSRIEVLKGPAIDRLHEFEKLGMEPEEIKARMNEQADGIASYIYSTEMKISSLTSDIDTLLRENKYLLKLCKEKDKEIKELKDKLNRIDCVVIEEEK